MVSPELGRLSFSELGMVSPELWQEGLIGFKRGRPPTFPARIPYRTRRGG